MAFRFALLASILSGSVLADASTSMVSTSSSMSTSSVSSSITGAPSMVGVYLPSLYVEVPFAGRGPFTAPAISVASGSYAASIVSACSSVTEMEIAFVPSSNTSDTQMFPYTQGPSFWGGTTAVEFNSSTGSVTFSCTVNPNMTTNYNCGAQLGLTMGTSSTTLAGDLAGLLKGYPSSDIAIAGGASVLSTASAAACAATTVNITSLIPSSLIAPGPAPTVNSTTMGSSSSASSSSASSTANSSSSDASALRLATSAYNDSVRALLTFAFAGGAGLLSLILL